MFRRMRNKLLIINMLIITALVLGCLAAIQITTNYYIRSDINQRLDRQIEMTRSRHMRGMRGEPANGGEQPRPDDMKNAPEGDMRREPEPDKFNSEIGIICDKDGNITETRMMFSPENIDLTDTVKTVIGSGKRSGSVVLDVESWAYRCEPSGDGYIIALTKDEAERGIIMRLNIMLMIAAVLSIGISFLISLISANRSIRPIEEAYNRQKQFVADASHELRTPLASISANIDVLLESDRLVPDDRKWLVYVKDEAERMTKLTNDLLTLARSDADEGKSIYPEISFTDIVEDVTLENEAVAFENGVMLNEDIAEGVNITAPPEGLRQLVLILIDNAIKYTPKGGQIDVRLARDGEKCIFEVENDGEISPEDLPHIFERFYRADKSRARESGGYGLGLAIARSLTDGMGGKICAASEAGRTRFTVTI